ncbi:MAG: FKBP-type peptidyl-prolyl cis-trans isomerase [Burkholderiaceae bacterium]|nr:MAG: FKBP-type peptidyl-prolyl cis-trans isomerase [Burkholderiaceae bacterium]
MKLLSSIFSLSMIAAAISMALPTHAQDSKPQTEVAQTAASQAAPTQTVEALKELKIIDTLVGTGDEAQAGKFAVVHYSGWLYDPNAADLHGKAFDSSVNRGPFTFPLGARRVIQGWDQGVQGMKVGGKRTLIIPSNMAYGERNVGNGLIPPNSDLIFDVELLEVKAPPPPPVEQVPNVPVEKIDRKVGKGKEAVAGKKVIVHYTGWLRDPKAKDQHGKEFDSSLKREPFSFTLGAREVIPGWDQGVAGMKEGGKRTLIIPAVMAYGSRGVGNGLIPPNSDLVFDVQLIKVK